MTTPIRSIVHPTDFSDLSGLAFAHALGIALAARARLDLLHVEDGDGGAFPHVRRLLVQWGWAREEDPPEAIWSRLGIEVVNVRLGRQDPIEGIIDHLSSQASDLVVLATRGRDGLEHLIKGSISEAVFRRTAIPTLFIARGARGFVDQVTGDLLLRRALVPIDVSPPPERAIAEVQRFARLLTGGDIVLHLLHVGSSAPALGEADAAGPPLPPVMLRAGNVVASVVDAAIEFDVDLIGMPTAGHHGILDALRGSTTERVIRHAPCPVLALPVT
jgi:nucleotide-binding universal stress UspA family protein